MNTCVTNTCCLARNKRGNDLPLTKTNQNTSFILHLASLAAPPITEFLFPGFLTSRPMKRSLHPVPEVSVLFIYRRHGYVRRHRMVKVSKQELIHCGTLVCCFVSISPQKLEFIPTTCWIRGRRQPGDHGTLFHFHLSHYTCDVLLMRRICLL